MYRQRTDSRCNGSTRQMRPLPSPSRCRSFAEAPPRRSPQRSGPSRCRVHSAATTTLIQTKQFDIQAEVKFLREDLQHLFDDQGIDESRYDDRVEFRDPISQFGNVQGYMFNIAFLKTVFDPIFELHDIRATGPDEVTTRWTMTMKFTPAAKAPLAKFWSPQLVFTGTSIYGYNTANGKINRHIDTWDSIYNQSFFSMEAFADFLGQMVSLSATPSLETPDFTILRRQKSGSLVYEIRRYEPFACAETVMDGHAAVPQSKTGFSPAGAGKGGFNNAGAGKRAFNDAGAAKRAFNALAGYILGDNEQRLTMRMTTPVFTTSQGTMSVAITPSAMQGNTELPAPMNSAVKLVQEEGGLYAVLPFNGRATPKEVARQEWLLREAVVKDGMVAGLNWKLARYNDPSIPDIVQRNEILIPVDGFDLWQVSIANDPSDLMSYGD